MISRRRFLTGVAIGLAPMGAAAHAQAGGGRGQAARRTCRRRGWRRAGSRSPESAAARRIPAGDASVRAGRFQLGTEAGPVLDGKTIGLIGLGRIGSHVACMLFRHPAMAARLLGRKLANVARSGADPLAEAVGDLRRAVALEESSTGLVRDAAGDRSRDGGA